MKEIKEWAGPRESRETGKMADMELFKPHLKQVKYNTVSHVVRS